MVSLATTPVRLFGEIAGQEGLTGLREVAPATYRDPVATVADDDVSLGQRVRQRVGPLRVEGREKAGRVAAEFRRNTDRHWSPAGAASLADPGYVHDMFPSA